MERAASENSRVMRAARAYLALERVLWATGVGSSSLSLIIREARVDLLFTGDGGSGDDDPCEDATDNLDDRLVGLTGPLTSFSSPPFDGRPLRVD